MSTIKLNGQSVITDTLVPNRFLDYYMPNANGEYVKIDLYLLRAVSSSMDISVNNIADIFNHTENDVLRALKYWNSQNLISLVTDESGNIQSISLNPVNTDNGAVNSNNIPLQSELISNPEVSVTASTEHVQTDDSPVKPVPSKQVAAKPSNPDYTMDQINSFKDNDDVCELLYLAEKYLGKTLSSFDINVLLFIYDELKFSTELIEYLIEYCVETVGKRSMRYIQSVAMDWAEDGIDSISKAKQRSELYSKTCYPVLKAFGISDRGPGKEEKAMIIKWKDTFGFSIDIIINACDRTINAIHKPSFKYADSILTNWNKKGVQSLEDIKTLDITHAKIKEQKASAPEKTSKNSFNNFDQRDFSGDYDSLEKKLLMRAKQGGTQ